MHNHSHSRQSPDVGNIRAAFFLNLLFTVIEIVGGVLTNSVAILSDAVHDLGDSFSLGLSWYFQKIAKRPRTRKYTYGYRRFSLMGALVNSVILTVGSLLILINAVPRLFSPQQPDARGMLLLAVLGVLVNGAAVLRLRRGHSLNEKVVSLHMLEDVLGWLAVLVGAGIMNFVDAPFIDPLLSILISLYILFNVYRNIRQSMQIILQGSPGVVSPDEVEKAVKSLEKVSGIHDLHIWSVDGEYNVMTLHVVLSEPLSMNQLHQLKAEIRKRLHQLDVQHITIEFETPDEDCDLEVCS